MLPVHVDTRRGHILVHPGENPALLETALCDYAMPVSDHPPERCTRHDSRFLDFDASWKVYLENYVEDYHVSSVHPAFDAEPVPGIFTIKARRNTITNAR